MKRLLFILWPRATPEDREAWRNASRREKSFVLAFMVIGTAAIVWLMNYIG